MECAGVKRTAKFKLSLFTRTGKLAEREKKEDRLGLETVSHPPR